MRIVHINTTDNVGGAARAMYRLHTGLRQVGQRSDLLVGARTAPDPEIHTLQQEARPYRTWRDSMIDPVGIRLEQSLSLGAWAFADSWRIEQAPICREADIINLHNIHGGYFNFRALIDLGRRKPLVWTLHDMWALTGHCAYSYGCERWRTGCFSCPLLAGSGRQIVEPGPTLIDRSRAVWNAKRLTYQRTPLHIVAPSQWLKAQIQRSILSSAVAIHCIPYGIDLNVFRPGSKQLARQALDLPPDQPVIFFSAVGLANRRKGLSYLLQALKYLPGRSDIWLLTSGEAAELEEYSAHFTMRQLGQIDEQRQSLAFTAADLFVSPTLADNLPLVLIEALACGIPAVAFDTGGVSEIVAHMETGYLARCNDSADLAKGIQTLLADTRLRSEMGHRCRQTAEAHYALKLQAHQYMAVYQQAIEQHHALPETSLTCHRHHLAGSVGHGLRKPPCSLRRCRMANPGRVSAL